MARQHRPKPTKKQLAAIRRAVFTRDDWTCQECGVRIPPRAANEESGEYAPTLKISGRRDFDFLELDHITPYSAGGAFTVDNLRAACSTCNGKKSASTKYADWPARIARARALLESRPANETTALAAIRALSGGDVA